jgi:hypothetical protein
MSKLGKREREARKRRKRTEVVTSQSGWQRFKLGRKKFSEFHKKPFTKFLGCVVNAER